MLIPIDGSRSSRRALRVGAALAKRLGGELDVVCFSRGPISRDFRRGVYQMAQEERAGVPTHVRVAAQHDAAEDHIARYVASHPASLVCMAAHARSRTPALLGSVTEAVIRAADQPVLLVGPKMIANTYEPSGPVMLTSLGGEQANIGEAWSQLFHSKVVKAAPNTVHAAARLQRASVIVVDMVEQGRFERLLSGSPTAELIHDAPCPVLVIHPLAGRHRVSTSAPVHRNEAD